MTADTPVEDRLRAALGAEAQTTIGAAGAGEDSLAAIRARVRTRRRRRHALLAGAAAVVVLAGVIAAPQLDADHHPVRIGDAPSTTPSTPPTTGPGGPGTSTLVPGPTVTGPGTGTGAPPVTPVPTTPSTTIPGAGFTMLWPDADAADAAVVQAAVAEGHQPWRMDPAQIAGQFTSQYLGFTENNAITSQDVRGDQAWIGVGSRDAATGQTFTAAVVHLRRFGNPFGIWEVVGTRDTDLTLESPAYGAAVASPIAVGGHITGVDESLRVAVHAVGATGPVGQACCLPAGGQATPWHTTVAYRGVAAGRTLTVVVSTGGHRLAVERFAVTAVRVP